MTSLRRLAMVAGLAGLLSDPIVAEQSYRVGERVAVEGKVLLIQTSGKHMHVVLDRGGSLAHYTGRSQLLSKFKFLQPGAPLTFEKATYLGSCSHPDALRRELPEEYRQKPIYEFGPGGV